MSLQSSVDTTAGVFHGLQTPREMGDMLGPVCESERNKSLAVPRGPRSSGDQVVCCRHPTCVWNAWLDCVSASQPPSGCPPTTSIISFRHVPRRVKACRSSCPLRSRRMPPCPARGSPSPYPGRRLSSLELLQKPAAEIASSLHNMCSCLETFPGEAIQARTHGPQ